MQVRNTNKRCLNCGAGFPHDVRSEAINDYIEFQCPKCRSRIAEAVIGTDGEAADTPRNIPYPSRRYYIREDVDWETWEVWWTDQAWAMLINGRPVNSPRDEMLALINHLEDYL